MDDDLQHPPEEIEKLLGKLTDQFDVVYGIPEREQHGVLRNLASKITKITLKSAMGEDIARNVTAFRVLRTSLRDAFFEYRGTFISLDALLSWGTTRFTAVKVRHELRTVGKSGYTVSKLFTIAFNLITSFSVIPLQIASILGFACSIFGLALLIYVVGKYFIVGGILTGFTFIASTIIIFSGAQMLALGIIGEYLARMHFRMMDRPSYAIRETTNRSQRSEDRNETKSSGV